MKIQYFNRKLPLNLYREEKNIAFCFLLLLKERKKCLTTCRLFALFGDPWPSCLLSSHEDMPNVLTPFWPLGKNGCREPDTA